MSEPEFSPNVIYQINRWSEVFETAVSRRYETLTWVSERVSFLGSGWQKGLDDHGDQWLAVYGAWMVIVRIAASNKREYRGVLCGEKGEPISAARIARIPGVSTKAIQECLSWAVKVGWLVPYVPESCQKNVDQTSAKHSQQLSEVCAKHTTGRDGTGRNVTKPNGTERDGIGDRSPAGPGPFGETSKNATQVIADLVSNTPELQALQSHRITPDASAPEEMTQSVFVPLRASDVLSKPPLWWAGVWYKRQLAAPDPVLRGCNAAEAAVVVALAMSLAKLPESAVKKSRTSMLISLLTKGAHGLPSRVAPCLPAAVDLLRKQLDKRTAAEVA